MKLSSSHLVSVLFLLCACAHHSHQEETSSHAASDRLNGLPGKVLSHVKEKEHEHDHHDHDDHEHHDHGGDPVHNVDVFVWLAASGSILAISACGIFGVLVIPLMQKVFYQHLIQFLVALAVGTLSGDALLHLFPHALMSGMELTHAQHEAYHENAVWRGFTALVALIAFFVLEKVVNAGGQWVERRKKDARRKSIRRASSSAKREPGELTTALTNGNGSDDMPKIQLVRSGHAPSDKVVGEPVCKNKYSNYCVSDVEGPTTSSNKERLHSQLLNKGKSFDEEDGGSCQESCAEGATSGSEVFTVQTSTLPTAEKVEGGVVNGGVDKVFLHEHEYMHHGHSHAHSHITSKPDSVSSVAWMVIFGDGIHNLADGMAIGAAFAQSYISGLSTSIAVLCHELPHEIGDFAMLLKAGMTVKQAVMYNLISSLLAFLGMILGLLLGNLESFSAWIFCATAGIFLYVALVDMIPELNSGHAHPAEDGGGHAHSHGAHSEWVELGLQLLGMLTGVGIMLLIALFEHDLKEAFY